MLNCHENYGIHVQWMSRVV